VVKKPIVPKINFFFVYTLPRRVTRKKHHPYLRRGQEGVWIDTEKSDGVLVNPY